MSKIFGREFDKQFLQKIVSDSRSVSNCAINLGFTFSNANLLKSIRDVIRELDIDSSHFNSTYRKCKYPKIIKECPVCKVSFEAFKGHPREATTCSCKCSNTYFFFKA